MELIKGRYGQASMHEDFFAFCEELDERGYSHDGLTVTYEGHVYLPNLKTMPDGVVFTNGGYVRLDNLTTLPEGVVFTNGSYVYMPSLTALPEGTAFNNQGYVHLSSLTTLPEGVTFSNGGRVYLPGLTDELQTYRGKTIRLRHIDGWTMAIGSTRKVGEFTVSRAHYFRGGDYKSLPASYVASDGERYAHGKTAELSIRDLRFKIAQVNYDAADLIARVKLDGVITWIDFRLLTGACEEGLQQGLSDLGLDPELQEMPLSQAMELVKGRYGEGRMREAFA